MKTAIVHDWLIRQRGGEKVLQHIADLYPEADIYTLFCDKSNISSDLASRKIFTSWLQYIPFVEKIYPFLLPFFPGAIRQFDLSDYDLVISSSHCVAKGFKRDKSKIHACYCHTPMRYAWQFQKEYFKGKWYGGFAVWFLNRLKSWDLKSAENVSYFCANSQEVQKRIKDIYGRDSEVIHPPLDLISDNALSEEREFYLVISALVPYKRIDLAVGVFNDLGLPLKIIGTGPCSKELKDKAKANIEFLGWVDDKTIEDYYSKAKAFIFPGLEDFGITPLEAQSYGCPVIAYGKGGALETVVQLKTGVFFKEQTIEGLREAINTAEQTSFDKELIRKHALEFRGEVFDEKFKQWIDGIISKETSRQTPETKVRTK